MNKKVLHTLEFDKITERLCEFASSNKAKEKISGLIPMADIDEILSVVCIGQIPDDEMVVTSTNRGEPCVTMPDSPAGQAYLDVVGRLSGEDIPFREFAKESLWESIKSKLFGKK